MVGAGGEGARLVFDMTTTALWSGPPVGIVRVEREFARWALANRNDLAPAFFDPQSGCFRSMGADVARRLVMQDATVNALSFVSPSRKGKRKTDRIPAALRPIAMWALQSRRALLQALERVRLKTTSRRIASVVDMAQRAIMSRKYRAIMVKPDGSRRDWLPMQMALGPPVELTARDTLICAGAGWTHTDIVAIAALKEQVGFRFVVLCFDIIPELYPYYYKAADVATHREYCQRAFAAADLVIFTSRRVEADVRAWCKPRRLTLAATAVCPLGADMDAPDAAAPLPPGLEAGRYAVLVSTIEPRKGHRLIYQAWVKLLQAGIPQRARFKLVFAGRVGWMVDDLMRDLRRDRRIAGSLLVFSDASDATVAALYRDATFCLYPSRYEGYGLPLIEAFRYGKAVLASDCGAVPEVAGDFSPCLDPTDLDVWRHMLETWIENPGARAPYETRIRTSFRHPDWGEAARMFFTAAQGRPGMEPSPELNAVAGGPPPPLVADDGQGDPPESMEQVAGPFPPASPASGEGSNP
jgi:glycosyltransferase involved in cell wall biosynthesis